MKYFGKREIVSGVILLFGVLTLFVHIYHLISEEQTFNILIGYLPPVIISVGLMASAYFVYRSQLPGRYFPRLLVWVLGGAIAAAALGNALVLYLTLYGSEIVNVGFMVFNVGAIGGLGGILIGYYDVRLQKIQSELAHERDLLEAREASLEIQNQRLEALAQIVSHDLRNPLNVVRGRIELARDTGDESHLETAASALDRMKTMIEDMLQMAKQDQTVEEGEMEEVSLREVAESSWGVVEAQEANLEVIDDLLFEADRSRLRNIFENLFRNAIGHGGTDITVKVGPLPDESGFYVEDDGTGISSTEDIFEAGYTSDADGTGLGLAIVQDIVTAHNWAIVATSSASGGARFEIKDVVDE